MGGSEKVNNVDGISMKNKHNKVDNILCYITIIDLLFMPYVRVLSVSISMILLPIWYMFNLRKIKVNREFSLFLSFVFFALFSFFISMINYPIYTKTNLINLGIIVFGFLYYFFLKHCFKNNSDIPLKKILIAYIIFNFALAVIYHYDSSLFFRVRSFWTMSGNVIEIKYSLLMHRFTGIFSDPNNAATMFVTILTFLLFNTRLTRIQRVLLIFIVSFILISTMSSTGFVVFGMILLLLIVNFVINLKMNKKIKIKSLFGVLLIPVVIYLAIQIYNTDVAEIAIQRFTQNSTDSRFDIWSTLLTSNNIIKYLIFGMGGTILVEGSPFKPHNGHLHLIYNYGMISYGIFMWMFFRIRSIKFIRYGFFLIPLFIGFTMNVGIYEPRFMNLFVLLVAMYSSDINENKKLMSIEFNKKNSA